MISTHSARSNYLEGGIANEMQPLIKTRGPLLMRRYAISASLLLFLVPTLSAAEIRGKTLRETWQELRADKGKVGWAHMLVYEVNVDGTKLIRTIVTEEMKYIRSGDPYKE